MDRTMDRIRILRGILLLWNALIIFLPAVSIWQENYPEQVYSQVSFIRGYVISGTGVGASPASGFTRFMSILFVILPLILAIGAGICSLIEQLYGKYAQIAGFSALCLYICQSLGGSLLWPKRLNDAQQYSREIGWWFLAVDICLLMAAYVLQFGLSMRKAKNMAAHGVLQSGAELPVHPDGSQVRGQTGNRMRSGRPLSPDFPEDGVSYTQTNPLEQRTHTAGMGNQALSRTQTEINLPLETAVPAFGQGKTEMRLPARGVMVGVSGVFAGKEITFRDEETLQLGRDYTNDLVFTNASHISRNHCSITWYAQKQKYFVVDRSSNGCFINGASVRLPKNVEIALDPGTVIDIGDTANRFRLE